MDFGIARAIADSSATMTQTQAVIGTAQYLSPEQARGETVDARSDLYSTGCLLFELLTGRPPFVADSPVAVAYQHVSESRGRAEHRSRADVPQAVDAIVLHALTKDRDTRYQTAAEFRADLEAALAGRRISDAALGSARGPGGRRRRRRAGHRGDEHRAAGDRRRHAAAGRPRGGHAAGRRGTRRSRTATGLWILLGLLAAALLAVAVLVLPGMLGGDKPPPADQGLACRTSPR